MKKFLFISSVFFSLQAFAQAPLTWQNVDSAYTPLPSSVHVYYTVQPIDTAPFRAFYLIADLKDKQLNFTTDTTLNRRLTPSRFFEKNSSPLVVVNGTFFSYETNRSLNVVMRDGKLLSYNKQTIEGRGKDTFTYRHVFPGAIGISKKRKADVAWIYTDSANHKTYQLTSSLEIPKKDSTYDLHLGSLARAQNRLTFSEIVYKSPLRLDKWNMQTAIGGGPVLLFDGKIKITNEEEIKFTGKAINDKHPRTAMGYTKDNHLIILVIEGRNNIAHGATLGQEAQILKDLGCVEALNLDGGGSSCLLINGRQTITSSDKEGQRPVPAVFIIRSKR